MLKDLQVIEIIKNGVSDRIKAAREYSELVNMHVTGKNIKEYTEKFNEHENANQKKLREKLMKSNKSVFSFLLRPLDKIFTAKGGSISYNLQENQIAVMKDFIGDVSDGLDIKEYLKKKVKLQYVIDPNGFVMLDIDNEGRLNTKVFTTNEVIWYDNRGNNINAVIFTPEINTDKEDEKEYYRVIDEKTDCIYVKDGDSIYLDESSVIENFFGYVPAYILGDTFSHNANLYTSVVDEILEDANEHLRDVSVNTVHKLSHGYAKYWQYPEACTTCGGEGVTKADSEDGVIDVTCVTCEGSGVKNKKDASDLMLIDIPKDGEQKVAPDVGGYINPSMEIWKQYKEDIADLKQYMFQCLWGSTYTTDGSNETATGRLLNVQPEAERVSGISTTFANIHEFILDCYGKAIFYKKDYKSEVSYGTRYLMESPDQVLTRYKEAVKEELPAVLQNDLLDRFYQTEYADNSLEYQKTKKVLLVDPFPSMTAAEVKDLGVSDDELLLKIYYPQWVNQLSEAKKTLMKVEQLKEDLNQFVQSKTIKNESNTSQV